MNESDIVEEKIKNSNYDGKLFGDLELPPYKLTNSGGWSIVGKVPEGYNLGTVDVSVKKEEKAVDSKSKSKKNKSSDSVFGFKLFSHILPEMGLTFKGFQPKVSKSQLKVSKSILDTNLSELSKMDISELRSVFLEEIKSLENVNEQKRDIQLQHIFSKLFDLQPYETLTLHSNLEFSVREHRLFADLISTPGLSKLDYVVDFLKNRFRTSYFTETRKMSLLRIFDYYSKHSDEACEKFNYVYRSSDEINFLLMRGTIDLEFYFSEKVISSFSKEDLSQLFRFIHYHDNVLKRLFAEENEKSLFLISQMTKKINSITGHSAEFLEKVFELFKDDFNVLLNDVYDKIVGGKENEKAFELTYFNSDNFDIMRELINYVSLKNERPNFTPFDICSTLEEFLNVVKEYRESSYDDIFESGALEKIKSGTFDFKADFKKITNPSALKNFKKGLLYNIYGITLDEAVVIAKYYGKYIEDLELSVLEKDRPILEMLKSIVSIVELDKYNLKEKIDVLRVAYLKRIEEKGLDYHCDIVSSIMLKGLLNRMYMNTFNRVLDRKVDDYDVIKYDDGVPILDAGVEFNFILSSLAGSHDDFFSSEHNMASKWNTASLSENQGLCVSFIDNKNLGVITLKYPILGFTNIPEYALNVMGNCDIFTDINKYNLRRSNDSRRGRNRYFIPANVLTDETRYGYNELLLDRFLLSDEDNTLKLQPSYVIFYKMGDYDFEDNKVYKNSLKLAKDFGIPLMVIDIHKVKDHEKETIKEMEKQLFSSTESRPKLLKDIVTRYMDNYTGSLTIIGERFVYSVEDFYEVDFSVEEMRRFFSELINFIDKIEDVNLRREWIINLEHVYDEEQSKFNDASMNSSWKNSVTTFILDELELKKEIKLLKIENAVFPESKSKEDIDIYWEIDIDKFPQVELENGEEAVFLTEKSYSPVLKTIFNLAESLDFTTSFELTDYEYCGIKGKLAKGKYDNYSNSLIMENIICSYFLGNCDELPLNTIINNCFDLDIKINDSPDYNWNKDFFKSLYRDKVKYNNILALAPKFVSKIEEMSDEDFLKIFNPIIEIQSETTKKSVEEIACNFLDKKVNMRERFEQLSYQTEMLRCGKDPNDYDANESKKSV